MIAFYFVEPKFCRLHELVYFCSKLIQSDMKNPMTRVLASAALALAALAITSCTGKKFHVSGEIADAKDSVLYFENMSLDGPVTVDSVKLGADGTFDFSGEAPQNPEFYRLRIAGQIINIAIDSTENVSVKASYPGMAAQYDINGSEECSKIKELALKQIDLQARAQAIAVNNNISEQQANDSIEGLINAYKNDVKLNYIFKEPGKAYAYFALFQAIGNRLIFNPRQSKDDVKVFAAVATSWDTYYPNSERGKNLHNIAIEGMKNIRIVENEQRGLQIDASKVQQTGIIDIELLDNRGVTRRLSDLKGKTVMLMFHVFASDKSTEQIMHLRSLYNKYHAQGFEIYMVSLDPDEHFWKEQTAALPWINVRDANGVNSQTVRLYNVQQLPAYYLIDKTNTLKARDSQIKDLEQAINNLL